MLFRSFDISPNVISTFLTYRFYIISNFGLFGGGGGGWSFRPSYFVLFDPMLFRPLDNSPKVISTFGHFVPMSWRPSTFLVLGHFDQRNFRGFFFVISTFAALFDPLLFRPFDFSSKVISTFGHFVTMSFRTFDFSHFGLLASRSYIISTL